MNRIARSFAKPAFFTALLLGGADVVAACSGGDVAIGDADGALRGKNDAGALDGGPAQDCVAQGGSCEAITPANNATCGSWGDPNSCGGGVGVGCCLHVCPDLVPPAPGFCAGGKVMVEKDAFGCSSHYCDAHDAGPANTCVAAGGTCQGLAPPSGSSTCARWGDASQFSCGGGIGVGCCFPQCPDLVQPPPGFCDGGSYSPTKDATGCITGFKCDANDGGAVNACTMGGGHCIPVAPGACVSWVNASCAGVAGAVDCCQD